VKPLGEQIVFGYCENCGIVYAIRERLQERRSAEETRNPEAGFEEPKDVDRQGRATLVGRPSQLLGSHWKCPDCDAEMTSDNDADLKFAIREHIREYHPNRSIG
jgi:predicted RNA-binding Zn-ribbon protein involved in translation (DUF1610 family)